MALLREAQQAAEEVLAADPELKSCPAAAERLREMFETNEDSMN